MKYIHTDYWIIVIFMRNTLICNRYKLDLRVLCEVSSKFSMLLFMPKCYSLIFFQKKIKWKYDYLLLMLGNFLGNFKKEFFFTQQSSFLQNPQYANEKMRSSSIRAAGAYIQLSKNLHYLLFFYILLPCNFMFYNSYSRPWNAIFICVNIKQPAQ